VSLAVDVRMPYTVSGSRSNPPAPSGVPWAWMINATTPVVCGDAIDVPCRYW
jgi:hypothetical protein